METLMKLYLELANVVPSDCLSSRELALLTTIEEARKRLAKGRALWNGPCHECDAVLAKALSK
jgi:hypothetical protein